MLSPDDAELRNDLLIQKLLRGYPISHADIAAAVNTIGAMPLSPQYAVLYRVSAIYFASRGDEERALDIYLPLLEHSIRNDGERPDWYNYSAVTSSADAIDQSQRFNTSNDEVDEELSYYLNWLDVGVGDCIADIGGAGGLLARGLAERASRVLLTDISDDLTASAAARFGDCEKVSCLTHDITSAPLPSTVDKCLMSFVTPMFKSMASFQCALENIHSSLRTGGRAIISNNYEIRSAEAAARNVLTPAKAPAGYSTLSMYERMLWLDSQDCISRSRKIGFGDASVLTRRELGDKRELFDLLLIK